MTTPTPLESLSDRELSECFAAEVAKLERRSPTSEMWSLPGKPNLVGSLTMFATSVDAVLPYAEKYGVILCNDRSEERPLWLGAVEKGDELHDAEQPTPARALAIALLKAARAQRADREERS